MYKKKGILIVFEGIEGSGKTFHIKRLLKKIKRLKLSAVVTREPGGVKTSEKIRNIILSGKKNKFNRLTDTLLYMAARNENLTKKIIPNLKKKKIVITDRFIDSTIAYQGCGLGANVNLINTINRELLGKIKPNFTFLLTINTKQSAIRINKRKRKNRYDKFDKKFYNKVQKAFVKIAKKNKKKYLILNTSKDFRIIEKLIYKRFLRLIK